ncbi:hypothetical protein AWB76_07521 [Caballeronia temeraria]|uniref:Integrase n=1 Tax=Caballeronia temeraria TaxID=1777137 RepID=A0A158DV00_9BURK|nr:hypothetical protein [Caballeronia temeraria]SAK98384.1 hypothetical protein AWB76_07521 [Caballeronia temeraria]
MSKVFALLPRLKADAERNLADYILHARERSTVFGRDLDFDQCVWDVTDDYSRRGHRNSKHGSVTISFRQRLQDGRRPFCDQLGEFARAYMRVEVANKSSSTYAHAIAAFRALDTVMVERCVSSLAELDATLFDRASEMIRSNSSRRENPAAGYMLGQIARFLDKKAFVYAPLHNWRYPRASRITNGRIGPEFERRRAKNMPPKECLDGLAQAFNLASDDRDVLITSIAAIMCSAPERINEVMVLPVNCEIEQTDSDGRTYLGLRWSGSKGAADHIKWILPGMAEVVRKALDRIRKITEPARAMARWYEEHPRKLFLPPELAHLRNQSVLTLDEVSKILNLSPGKRAARGWINRNRVPLASVVPEIPLAGHSHVQAVRFEDIEAHVVATVPQGFPIYDERRRMRYSEALLVIAEGLFGNRNETEGSHCMFETVKYHHIGCSLGQNKRSGSTTVFQRVGIDPDGKLAMRSHQFRHWLNTLAQSESLSQLDIAKWSGRTTLQHNSAYDHVSSEDIVARIRTAVGDHGKAIGPLAEIPKNLPVTRSQFAAMIVPTAHVTPYGFCIHDFTTTPCERFRQCLDCQDHVCLKGLADKTSRVAQALEDARESLSKAFRAVADGVFGADDWVAIHKATVKRLDELLNILTDTDVSDGAVVQLNSIKAYSLSDGALSDALSIRETGAEL